MTTAEPAAAGVDPADHRVDQTLFLDTPGRQGNCLSACIATYLAVPLEAVPHFAEYLPDDGSAWWHLYIGFMAGHGRWPVELDDPHDADPGEVERGVMHQVLYRDGTLWHDPHPSRAGLLGVTEVIAWRSQRHDHGPTLPRVAAHRPVSAIGEAVEGWAGDPLPPGRDPTVVGCVLACPHCLCSVSGRRHEPR